MNVARVGETHHLEQKACYFLLNSCNRKPMSQEPTDGIPFSFFCSLLREISRVPPVKSSARNQKTFEKEPNYPAIQIFRRWFNKLNSDFSPLPKGTTAACFRLLFPEEDIRRKYDMQETRLAECLTHVFGVNSEKFRAWNAEEASGCLGQEVKIVLQRSCPTTDGFISPLTIEQVDELLDELASNSGYSHSSIHLKYPRGRRRSRQAILRQLFCPLPPFDASCLTQIILKDLRPLIYPLAETHYTASLRDFNSAAVKMLTKEHAMNVWDPSGLMLKSFLVRSSIDVAAGNHELPQHLKRKFEPELGIPIQIPKSEKGRRCKDALAYFLRSKRVWAETKYDGERAQIHVVVNADGSSRITIFSKSKRDSTHDRHAVHYLIRNALGLPNDHTYSGRTGGSKVKLNVILDAEMVACNGTQVDEFWRIRRLIENTAHGIRGVRKGSRVTEYQDEPISQTSMLSDDSEARQLGLVFFDVLMLDSKSLLSKSYSERREILESLISVTTGEAILSERFPIDMNGPHPSADLRTIFARHICTHQEGLVIKCDESRYNDYRLPWVKLKRDYIPGYGDALDLVILGASWDKKRAYELRVSPTVLTTFYVGTVQNARDRRLNPAIRPHFLVYFTVSYGLSRAHLEDLNFLIRCLDPISFSSSMDTKRLAFTFTLFPGLQPPPSVILPTPLLAELFGAGFTKSPASRHYELRFPRITKVHRPSERGWDECVDLETLHKIACESVGRDESDKEIRDCVNAMWGQPASPGVKSSVKRKARMEEWEVKLAILDGEEPSVTYVPDSPTTPVKRRRTSTKSLDNVLSQPLGVKTNVVGVTEGKHALDPPKSSSQISQNRRYLPSPFGSPCKPALRDAFPLRVGETSPIRTLLAKKSSCMEELLDQALVWFVGRRGRCPSCSSWKKKIPKERRIHSFESLLAACGWKDGVPGVCWIQRGIIIVDGHDENGKDWVQKRLELCHKSMTSSQREDRKAVWMFKCGAMRDAICLLE